MILPPALRQTGLPRLLAAGALCLLAGCVVPNGTAPGTAARDVPPPEAPVAPLSAESRAAAAYYAQVQENYLAQGLMRTDDGATDAPFTDRQLAENFIAIAFFDEFGSRNGELVATGTENRLHRWDGPIRVRIDFGPTVPSAQRTKDRAAIAGYLHRLSALTGLPISIGAQGANFAVMILNAGERQASGPAILAFAPEAEPAALRSVTQMGKETYCTVLGFAPRQSAVYSRAVAVIRGELPDEMRMLCVHEELSQGLGLVNDSPRARPSIFNDNEEFALLTLQDELMLRILYDRRLRPGMTAAEARPIVETIATELAGSRS